MAISLNERRVILTSMVLWVACGVSPLTIAAAEEDRGSNFACVEKLKFPAFPLLATQARIQGTVTASLVVSEWGLASQPGFEYTGVAERTRGLLISPVEKSLRDAKFRSSCAGKKVKLVFHFQLSEHASNNPTHASEFHYPNQFWIFADAPLFQP